MPLARCGIPGLGVGAMAESPRLFFSDTWLLATKNRVVFDGLKAGTVSASQAVRAFADSTSIVGQGGDRIRAYWSEVHPPIQEALGDCVMLLRHGLDSFNHRLNGIDRRDAFIDLPFVHGIAQETVGFQFQAEQIAAECDLTFQNFADVLEGHPRPRFGQITDPIECLRRIAEDCLEDVRVLDDDYRGRALEAVRDRLTQVENLLSNSSLGTGRIDEYEPGSFEANGYLDKITWSREEMLAKLMGMFDSADEDHQALMLAKLLGRGPEGLTATEWEFLARIWERPDICDYLLLRAFSQEIWSFDGGMDSAELVARMQMHDVDIAWLRDHGNAQATMARLAEFLSSRFYDLVTPYLPLGINAMSDASRAKADIMLSRLHLSALLGSFSGPPTPELRGLNLSYLRHPEYPQFPAVLTPSGGIFPVTRLESMFDSVNADHHHRLTMEHHRGTTSEDDSGFNWGGLAGVVFNVTLWAGGILLAPATGGASVAMATGISVTSNALTGIRLAQQFGGLFPNNGSGQDTSDPTPQITLTNARLLRGGVVATESPWRDEPVVSRITLNNHGAQETLGAMRHRHGYTVQETLDRLQACTGEVNGTSDQVKDAATGETQRIFWEHLGTRYDERTGARPDWSSVDAEVRAALVAEYVRVPSGWSAGG